MSNRCERSLKLYGSCELEAGHEGPHRIAWYGDDGRHVVSWTPELERMIAANSARRGPE